MILGVSGSRMGITTAQHRWLENKIRLADEVHHGACTGADEESHRIALDHGKTVVVHPPTDSRYMMAPDWNHDNVTVLVHKPYHMRDRAIVARTDLLAATPNTAPRPRSGTWYTVGYALDGHRPVEVCYPDGTVTDGTECRR
jgi:hypothetical protein